MGNKTNPVLFRLGVSQKHLSSWFADKRDVPKVLDQDLRARKYLMERFDAAVLINRIVINRFKDHVEVLIKCLKPSIIIGKKGCEIDVVVNYLSAIYGMEVRVKIFEIRKKEADVVCVAKDIARALTQRGVVCRKIIKKAVKTALRSGVLGAKIICSGRLGGVEIARTEEYHEGPMPRGKYNANILYSAQQSFASWGVCGVKVYFYLGDYISGKEKSADKVSIDSTRKAPLSLGDELDKMLNKSNKEVDNGNS